MELFASTYEELTLKQDLYDNNNKLMATAGETFFVDQIVEYGFDLIASKNSKTQIRILNSKMNLYFTRSEIKSKFTIYATFKIAGRGIVFAGNIYEGRVSNGDDIVFKYRNVILKRKIAGVEGIFTKRKYNCGLLIETMDEEELQKLRNWEPNEVESLIYENSHSVN